MRKITSSEKQGKVTCHFESCNKAFDEGDKHLENNDWQSGYWKEKEWYCSTAHLRKSTRYDGYRALLAAVFVFIGIAALAGGVVCILSVFWPSKFSGSLWEFIACLAIASFSFWYISKAEKLR